MTSTALTLAMPAPSAASLDSYISAVNRIPLLTQEEETRLARDWRDHENIDSARGLVLSHLRLVVAIARGYLGYGLPQADLIQEGNVGLMKAVKRFDPERGVRLVSFAVHWIKAEMHEYILKNWRMVKIATTKAQRKLFFNLRSMKSGLSTLTPAEIDAIATELRVKPEEVVEMETRLGGGDVALEPSGDDDDEHSYAPIAYLMHGDDEPSKALETRQIAERRSEGLVKALDKLDTRSRRIIETRWLRETDTATLHELADEFGVSAERIRQIEAQAMKKMRVAMADAA
jgi:RNA polymerase sigma-32 factor